MALHRLNLSVTDKNQRQLVELFPIFNTGSRSEVIRQLIEKEYNSQVLANRINPQQQLTQPQVAKKEG